MSVNGTNMKGHLYRVTIERIEDNKGRLGTGDGHEVDG